MINRIADMLAASTGETAQQHNIADVVILDMKTADLISRSNEVSKKLNQLRKDGKTHPEALTTLTDEELEVMHARTKMELIFKLLEVKAGQISTETTFFIRALDRIHLMIHEAEDTRGIKSTIEPLDDNSGVRVQYSKNKLN